MCRNTHRRRLSTFLLAAFAIAAASPARGAMCPFCGAVQPSFAERREACDVLLLAEAKEAASATQRTFEPRQVLQGRAAWDDGVAIEIESTIAAGRLALLLGTRRDDASTAARWAWEAIAVDEFSLAYFVRAPALDQPAVERLRYFAKHLEADDDAVADDAFREFGVASYDAVAEVADAFDYAKVRAWIVDRQVRDERKGFYGMVLGLARDEATRAANAALLRKIAWTDMPDFRAGFDGVLAGLLLVDGEAALDQMDARILKNAAAKEGDVRHAQAAVRFYLQFGRDIPAPRLLQSIVLLLDHGATAPVALTDLTRREQWGHVERAAKLFNDSPGNDPLLDQAVVGYLLTCPKAEAAATLGRLRAGHPRRVEKAEFYWSALGVRGGT